MGMCFLPFGKNTLSILTFPCVKVRNSCGSERSCVFFGGAASVAPLFILRRNCKMRRIVILLLTLGMTLLLSGCGTSVKSDNLIGTWTCNRSANQDAVSEDHTTILDLYKGNSFFIRDRIVNGEEYNQWHGTWEYDSNNNLVILHAPMSTIGLEFDSSTQPFTLKAQSDSSVILIKQQ